MLGHIPNGGAHLHQSVMAKPMGIWVEDDNARRSSPSSTLVICFGKD